MILGTSVNRLSAKCRKFSKMPADIIGFGYALTVAAGGIIGYLKAGKVHVECCHAFLVNISSSFHT